MLEGVLRLAINVDRDIHCHRLKRQSCSKGHCDSRCSITAIYNCISVEETVTLEGALRQIEPILLVEIDLWLKRQSCSKEHCDMIRGVEASEVRLG